MLHLYRRYREMALEGVESHQAFHERKSDCIEVDLKPHWFVV
jgi:hypothetical protein